MEAEARMPPLCPSCAPAVFGRVVEEEEEEEEEEKG
jgi:hypothetical protein